MTVIPLPGIGAAIDKAGAWRAIWRAIWRTVLRVPLLAKLLGANLLIVLAALAAHIVSPGGSLVLHMTLALAASFVATTALVWIALRPLAQLEAVAQRVSDGDWNARVPASPIADASVSRLAATLNRLLDRAQADRARIEYLAGRSVRARDIEREAVARELRESLAQMVAAIALELAGARRANRDGAVHDKLDATRTLVSDLSDQLRGVAESLYPGTIGEFGLPNALRALARVTARKSGVQIDVDAEAFDSLVPPSSAAALFRAADEALRNVVRHSGARRAGVTLATAGGDVTLEITDDGRGMDLRETDPIHAGLGLFSARSLLALAGGELQVSSSPSRGTRVHARVPAATATRSPWQAISSA